MCFIYRSCLMLSTPTTSEDSKKVMGTHGPLYNIANKLDISMVISSVNIFVKELNQLSVSLFIN
jgi:hypothetical protein